MSNELCIGSFVTFDISGKKFEAVLTREIEMTNKVKRSELADVMESYYINYEAKVSILSEICNLLGDLVENDQLVKPL